MTADTGWATAFFFFFGNQLGYLKDFQFLATFVPVPTQDTSIVFIVS